MTACHLAPLNVLLVEDNEIHKEVYMRMVAMDNSDHTVTACENGQSALQEVEKAPDAFDCVLLDIHLPDINGFEVAKKIRELNEFLPIIIITADDDETLAYDALSIGVQDYHLKGEYGQILLMRSIRFAIERKMHEYEAKQLKNELEVQSALYQRQRDFSSMVSHEFRTPLSIMSSAVQMMRRKSSADELSPIEKYTQKIESSIKRLTRLMDAALYYNKLEEGKIPFSPKAVDMKAMLLRLIDDFKDLNPDMEISLHCEQMTKSVMVDEGLIEHAISNVMSNALKYSQGASNKVDVSTRLSDGFFEIVCRDYGRGISHDDLKRIGERFFRGENTLDTYGTGIGVYIVRYIMKLHKGEMKLESQVKQGTTVVLTIPMDSK